MGNEKYRMSGSAIRRQHELRTVLQAQSRIREAMDPFGITAVVITEFGGLDIAKSTDSVLGEPLRHIGLP